MIGRRSVVNGFVSERILKGGFHFITPDNRQSGHSLNPAFKTAKGVSCPSAMLAAGDVSWEYLILIPTLMGVDLGMQAIWLAPSVR